MQAFEADRVISELRAFQLKDYGGGAWMDQHAQLEQLNVQAHINAQANSDPFVMESFITHDKMKVLVHELLAAEAWSSHVFPRVRLDLEKQSSLRAYYMLYHEATCANLLEAFLYHEHAAEELADNLVDLIDYLARRVQEMAARSHNRQLAVREERRRQAAAARKARKAAKEAGAAAAAGAEAAAAGAAAEGEEDDPRLAEARRRAQEFLSQEQSPTALAASLSKQADTIRFDLGVTAVAMLRYLCEHVGKLPVAVTTRMLETHDLVLATCYLIENPPWTRKQASGGGLKAVWEKFVDHKWAAVEPRDLMKLTKTEAQAWLCLHYLVNDPACRSKYPMHSYRRSTVLRVRKFLNEVLVDQLPPLAQLQRFLDELAVMEAQPTTMGATQALASGGGSRGGTGTVPAALLLEVVPELAEGIAARAFGDAAKLGGSKGTKKPAAGPAASASAAADASAGEEALPWPALAGLEERWRPVARDQRWDAVARMLRARAFLVPDREDPAMRRIAAIYAGDTFAEAATFGAGGEEQEA